MLVRVLNHISEAFLNRSLAPAYLAPLATNTASSNGGALSIRDILDGHVFATPKRRNSPMKVMRNRYGNDNWKDGTKLFKPKRNIVTCMECGNFHEFHTICRSCFKKVQDESSKIIEGIKSAWGRGIIDKEVQVLYQGESASTSTHHKRIVEMDRPRPLWFAPNLSQKSANPARMIGGTVRETDNLTVRAKRQEEDKDA